MITSESPSNNPCASSAVLPPSCCLPPASSLPTLKTMYHHQHAPSSSTSKTSQSTRSPSSVHSSKLSSDCSPSPVHDPILPIIHCEHRFSSPPSPSSISPVGHHLSSLPSRGVVGSGEVSGSTTSGDSERSSGSLHGDESASEEVYRDIFAAVRNNEVEVLQNLPVNSDVNQIRDHETGLSLLHVLSGCNSVDLLRRVFVERVADVDCRHGPAYHTPLHRAALKGALEALQILLENGADPNAATKWGGTALLFAASQGHLEVVEELIKHKADVNALSKFGSRPLLAATHNLHRKVVSALLENGAEVDQKNLHGRTALHVAVGRSHYPSILLLLHYGASPSLADAAGKTALELAIQTRQAKKIVELLRAVGDDGLHAGRPPPADDPHPSRRAQERGGENKEMEQNETDE